MQSSPFAFWCEFQQDLSQRLWCPIRFPLLVCRVSFNVILWSIYEAFCWLHWFVYPFFLSTLQSYLLWLSRKPLGCIAWVLWFFFGTVLTILAIFAFPCFRSSLSVTIKQLDVIFESNCLDSTNQFREYSLTAAKWNLHLFVFFSFPSAATLPPLDIV